MKLRNAKVILGTTAIGAAAAALYFSLKPDHPPGDGEKDSEYVDARACQTCHGEIWNTYRKTGMGRSFFRPESSEMVEDWSGEKVLHHGPSDRYFRMYRRGGKYYQRRHQIGFDGGEMNVVEKEIHFVLGSGNHARSYLHQYPDGKVVQLPVSWYRENNGFWAMSPGYDRADHHDFRRRITHECMFCHNSYPEVGPGDDAYGNESIYRGRVPEGIDCQRCHGPGREHVRVALTRDATSDKLRATIVNPARLDNERQIEICMQCHLETTSRQLPPYIRRFGRGFFSFRPGEKLSDYILHFDHPPGTGYDDKFEIVSAPYRLRRSLCFTRSGGSLTCTTCHNPHDIPRGEAAERHYATVCMRCHSLSLAESLAAGRHPAAATCTQCHMPKRRTKDVIHAVMTDHYIQLRPPKRDLLAPLDEATFYDRKYQGEVIYYYPTGGPPTDPEADLYLGVAEVVNGTNLAPGIARLERAIERHRPKGPEFHVELAEAYVRSGQFEKAVPAFKEALRRNPSLWFARHGLGIALSKLGMLERAAAELDQAARLGSEKGVSLNSLGLVYARLGRKEEAIALLRSATSIEPELAEAYNNLGALLLEAGDTAGAEASFLEALRSRPDLVPANHNLAKLLAAKHDTRAAEFHFERALAIDPGFGPARFDYGMLLAQMELYDRAEAQLEQAASLAPNWAEAQNKLGEVLAIRGKLDAALLRYRRAIELKPDFYEAHFNLGTALAVRGDRRKAIGHLKKAAESVDPELRRQSLEMTRKISSN